MFTITVEFEIEPEHTGDFRDAVLAQAENSLTKEPWCHRFDVSFDPDAAGHVFLYELYDDRAAFDRHLKTDHFLSFDTAVRDWVKSKKVKSWSLAYPRESTRLPGG